MEDYRYRTGTRVTDNRAPGMALGTVLYVRLVRNERIVTVRWDSGVESRHPAKMLTVI